MRAFSLILVAVMITACTPTASNLGTDQFTSGSVHSAVSGATSYSRSGTQSDVYTADPGVALGNALARAATLNSGVQRLAEQLPNPQNDPALQLASTTSRLLGGRPNVSQGRNLGSGASDAAARARAAGLSGAIVEVSGTRLDVYGSGAATQLGGNRVVVALETTLSLVDVASGEVLARYNCRENTRTRRAEVEAETAGFVTRQANALVQTCASAFLGQIG